MIAGEYDGTYINITENCSRGHFSTSINFHKADLIIKNNLLRIEDGGWSPKGKLKGNKIGMNSAWGHFKGKIEGNKITLRFKSTAKEKHIFDIWDKQFGDCKFEFVKNDVIINNKEEKKRIAKAKEEATRIRIARNEVLKAEEERIKKEEEEERKAREAYEKSIAEAEEKRITEAKNKENATSINFDKVYCEGDTWLYTESKKEKLYYITFNDCPNDEKEITQNEYLIKIKNNFITFPKSLNAKSDANLNKLAKCDYANLYNVNKDAFNLNNINTISLVIV